MTPGKGKLSVSMLPGKPKRRCIYLSFQNICCNKEHVKGNKYCAEHIEPQCSCITLPLGRQCKNKVYFSGEIHCEKEKEEE